MLLVVALVLCFMGFLWLPLSLLLYMKVMDVEVVSREDRGQRKGNELTPFFCISSSLL